MSSPGSFQAYISTILWRLHENEALKHQTLALSPVSGDECTRMQPPFVLALQWLSD